MLTVRKKIFIAFFLTASLVSAAFGQKAQSVTQTDAQSPRPRAQSVTQVDASSPRPRVQSVTGTDVPSPSPRVVAPIETTEAVQQARPAPKADAAPPAVEYAQTRDFKGRVFDVKHRDPSALVRALAPLGSGFAGTMIRFEHEFKTITVRDFPENIAAMEEALKRLDTPEPPRPDIELNMHVLIASNVEGAANQHPAALNDVVRQLQATLNYKNYYLVTSIVQRVKDGTRGINGQGIAELQAPLIQSTADVHYEWGIRLLSTSSMPSGALTIEVENLGFSLTGRPQDTGNVRIQTSLNAREGEKVVVGTASIKDKAMILVLTAKVVK